MSSVDFQSHFYFSPSFIYSSHIVTLTSFLHFCFPFKPILLLLLRTHTTTLELNFHFFVLPQFTFFLPNFPPLFFLFQIFLFSSISFLFIDCCVICVIITESDSKVLQVHLALYVFSGYNRVFIAIKYF